MFGLNLNVKISLNPEVIPFEFETPVTYINPEGSISIVEASSLKFPPKFHEFDMTPVFELAFKMMKSMDYYELMYPNPTA